MIEDDYHAPDHPLACPRCGGYAGGELLCTRCEKAEDERLRTQAQQATRVPLRSVWDDVRAEEERYGNEP